MIVNSDPNSVSSVRSSPQARVILQSLHIGPEARAIFNLVEEYKPLSQAYNEKNSKWFDEKLSYLQDNNFLAEPKALSAPTRPVKHQPVKALAALPEILVAEPQQLGRSSSYWPRSSLHSIRPQDDDERKNTEFSSMQIHLIRSRCRKFS